MTILWINIGSEIQIITLGTNEVEDEDGGEN